MDIYPFEDLGGVDKRHITKTRKGTYITHMNGLRLYWDKFNNRWRLSKYQDEDRNIKAGLY